VKYQDLGDIRRGVVKIGGASGNNLKPLVMELAERVKRGEEWLLVHGASSYMDNLSRALNITPKYVMSPGGFKSRFVNSSDLELFRAASSLFSIQLVSSFGQQGINAVPLYPPDNISAIARRKDALRVVENGKVRLIRGNCSGFITSFKNKDIFTLWDLGAFPVLPPLACDETGEGLLNVDGDRMAAAAAASLEADVLVILSNIPGLLQDPSDSSTLIKMATLEDWANLESYSQGNMKRKLLAAKEALEGGVNSVFIGDSRQQNPLKTAFSGGGTRLCRSFTEAAV
jgi:acetylglutamate/LysW-gamma-L-alpha-aminoadipate kinase